MTPAPRREWLPVLALALLGRALVYAAAAMANAVAGAGRNASELLCSWDCGWYFSIAYDGYQAAPAQHPSGDAANWAFFPLFPLATRALMPLVRLTGLPAEWAGQIVSNAAFVLALLLLHRMLRRSLNAADSLFISALLAFSPYGVYFSAPYTESLYLLLMVLCLALARDGRWLAAGAAAAALSATRNLGVFIVLPLLALAVAQHGWRPLLRAAPGTEGAWFALALAPLGLSAYMLFLHGLVGDALAFKHVQIAWGGQIGNPLAVIWEGLAGDEIYPRLCALALLAGLAAALWLWRRGWAAEAWVLALGALIPAAVRLASAPRYVFTLYPLYLALGLLLQRWPRARWALLLAALPATAALVTAWVLQRPWTT
jgi:hypothetical protein